jgi:predicted O-methyltransferase YrrM
MINQSVRFFPYWQIENTTQVIGFLDMLNYIVSINPNIEHYVEIGSNIGESTVLILGFSQIKNIHCVDIWEDSNLKSFFDARIATSEKNNIKTHHTSSKQFAEKVDYEIDVVYIDGDHSYDYVKDDISLWYPKIKSGGFLCGHDYNQVSWPDCKRAIDEFAISNNYNIKVFSDTSWVIQKK